MKQRKNGRQSGEIEVKVVCEPDPEAEDRFWKLYIQLVLEQMLKNDASGKNQTSQEENHEP